MPLSLQILLVGTVAGIAAGYGWYARFRDQNRSLMAKSLSFVLPPAGFALLMVLWMVLAEAPFDPLSPLTLASSAALWARGASDLRLGGPLLPVAFAPAALLGAPTRAMLFGGMMSLAWVFVPAFLLCRTAGNRTGAQVRFAMGAFLAFALLCLHSEILRFAAIRCGPAAPSAGLLILAICRLGDGAENEAKALRAAWWTAAAVLIQPSFFPAVFFFGGWVAATRGFAAAKKFLQALLVTIALGAVVCGIFYPFNTIAQMLFFDPWVSPWAEGSQVELVGLAILEVLMGYGPLFLALFFYGAFRRSVPALRRWRATQSVWPLTLAAAAGVFPGAMLDRVQVGGDSAAWSPVLFFLFLSVCLAAAEELGRVRQSDRPLAALIAVLTFVMLVTIHIGRIGTFRARVLATNAEEKAYRFAKKHPKQIYFPQHPLATALADHVTLPIADRSVVGAQVLPKTINRVAWTLDEYVEASSPTASSAAESKRLLLASFPIRATDPDLEGWILHEGAEAPPVPPAPVAAPVMRGEPVPVVPAPEPEVAPPPKVVVKRPAVMPPLNRKKRKPPARLPPL